MVLSASGNSPNLIKAVEMARDRAMSTVGLLGFDGGRLRSLVDDVILVETRKGAYELVEDVHSVLAHAVTKCLIADVAEAC